MELGEGAIASKQFALNSSQLRTQVTLRSFEPAPPHVHQSGPSLPTGNIMANTAPGRRLDHPTKLEAASIHSDTVVLAADAGLPTTTPAAGPAPPSTPPDGGPRAWASVGGTILCQFASFGLINAYVASGPDWSTSSSRLRLWNTVADAYIAWARSNTSTRQINYAPRPRLRSHGS